MGKPIYKLVLTLILIFPLYLNAETELEVEEKPNIVYGTLATILLGEGLILAHA